MMQLTAQAYTVAWLCALPLSELVVATAMLDEEHDSLSLSTHDENSYTYGSISGHNVVIACLPPGLSGTVSASKLVQPLSQSFPNLKIHLFVGIGGGVPRVPPPDNSEKDIHLGDVAIGWAEQSGVPGVVQWDLVRYLEGGNTEPLGILDKPDRRILSALGLLLRNRILGRTRFPEHLRRLQKLANFSHPGLEHDKLFKSTYHHVGGPDCSFCDHAQLVERPPRANQDLIFHQGTIASGDAVMKDPQRRNDISQIYHRAICFETEAAGVMDDKRCLIIRGIANYADSHKDSLWQNYAAGTAAAFARELLSTIQPQDISETVSQRKTQEQQACLQSLAFPEMSLRGNDIKDEAFKTCQWLLLHENYTSWFHQPNGLLWIKGKPGAGKSTLIKYALRESQQQGPSNKSVIASFFFHGRGAPMQKDPLGLFRSLLHQLLDQIPELLSEFCSIFRKRCESEGGPGKEWDWHITELKNFLSVALPRIPNTYTIRIYVDALDECGEENAKELVKLFDRLTSKLSYVETTLSICFSCRHYPLVAFRHGLTICVEDENSDDISRYVQDQLRQEFSNLEAQDLEKEIVRRASGIFQWVVLVVATMIRLSEQGCSTRKIQKKLQETPTELHSLYQDILDNVMQKDDRSQSLLLMQWVCFAQRPLSIEELRPAMVIGVNTTYTTLKDCIESEEYAESNEQMKKRIKSLSGGLVEVKIHGNHLQFIHQSVNDYLIHSGLQSLAGSLTNSVIGQAHFQLSRSCIKYIALKEVGEKIGKYDKYNYAELEREFPFLRYSITTWISHAEKVEAEKVPQGDLLSLFQWPSNQILKCWTHYYRIFDYNNDRRPCADTTLLHLASRYNFTSIVEIILNSDNDIRADLDDGNGRTSLSWAAGSGHEAVVRLPLERDNVDTNAKDENGRTPLWWAAGSGRKAVVQLLLERNDVEADSKDENGRTPLFWAAESAHEAVVQLLLERDDVDTNAKDENGRTPLSWVAGSGRKAVVQLLLERNDVEADSKDENGRTPLLYAAESGHEAVVRLLLERNDVEADSKDENGRTPLLYAVGSKHEAVVQLLLERNDVEADSKDENGRTPLSWAADSGYEAVVRLLLERNDVEADSKDENGRTPLSWAAGSGREAVVQLLLERNDVEADSKDENGRTPLLYATESGYKAVVRLLLERNDVEADSKDENGRTPLLYATESGYEAVVQLLLERNDVEADSKDENGRTPLSWAARSGYEAVVRLLLERNDVEANSKDENGRTPLSWAAESGRKAVVQLLLKWYDIDANSNDENGRTPLSWAAGLGHSPVVRLLLKRDDVETNSKDANGQTPLLYAVKSLHLKVVQLLLMRYDNDADSNDENGRTPLSWAASLGHSPMVRLFLKRNNVDANAKDGNGRTPLSWAAESGRKAVVQLLLGRNDVEADSKDENGRTPLSWAADSGHEEVVRLLLERNDVNADWKDDDGQTPLMLATRSGHDAVVQLLLKRKAE